MHDANHRPIFLEVRFFLLVGAVATCVHILVALLLLRTLELNVFVGNAVGFLMAVNISFWGHYNLTFQSRLRKQSAFIRFFLVAILAFLCNNLALISLLKSGAISETAALFIANAAIPIVTFFVSKLWAFIG